MSDAHRVAAHVLAGDDEAMAAWREKVIRPRVTALRDFFAQGVAAGTLRADVDYDLVIEMVLGGAVAGRSLRGGELPDTWARSVVDLVCRRRLSPVRARGRQGAESPLGTRQVGARDDEPGAAPRLGPSYGRGMLEP